MWLSRGVRQADYDVWKRKPVLVCGNWKHPLGVDCPKGYFSYSVICRGVAELLVDKLPGPGECCRIHNRKKGRQ